MTQPLALVVYEELKPGSQLVNRLQDLHYRVQSIADPGELGNSAQTGGPMLIFADLGIQKGEEICSVIAKLKKDPATAHIPVIGFADDGTDELQAAARQAGATVVATDTAILAHLPELIQQALQTD